MEQKSVKKADAVFEGGGVKGIGLVGALSVAEERGYRWENVAGTSAGAIVAALVAAGYTAPELKSIMQELDYNLFKDAGGVDKIPVAGPAASLVFEKGIYEGKFLESWLGKLLRKKNIETFGQLVVREYEKEERYRFRLRVIASDISRGKMIVLPQDIALYGMRPEDLGVVRAVRMSMSFPFFYEPVKLRNRKTKEASYVIDGGLLSNFPVWLFDSETDPAWPTFGFKLVPPEAEQALQSQISSILGFTGAIVKTLINSEEARFIADEHFVRTIAISTLDVSTLDFDLSRDKSDALFESGRRAAEKFFKTWNWDTYKAKFRSGRPRVSRGDRLRSP